MVDFNYLPTYQPQLVSGLYPFFWGGDISPGIKVLAFRHQGTGCLKAFGVLVGVYTVGAVRSLNGCLNVGAGGSMGFDFYSQICSD